MPASGPTPVLAHVGHDRVRGIRRTTSPVSALSPEVVSGRPPIATTAVLPTEPRIPARHHGSPPARSSSRYAAPGR